MTDLFAQRLRRAARELPAPDAPPDLIDRVLAERGQGERIILPTETPKTRRSRSWTLGIAAAAACVAAISVFVASSSTSFLRRSMLGIRTSSADSLESTGSFFVSPAYAAQPATGPSFPPLAIVAPPALRPGTYRYRLQYVDSMGRVTPNGTGTVHVSSVAVVWADALNPRTLESGEGPGTTQAWFVEHQSQSTVSGQQRVEAETLIVAKRDLRLISRDVTVRPYLHYSAIRISQLFRNDSVVGEMTTDGGVRRTIARRLPGIYAPYLSDALAPFTLSGVQLSKNWKASLSIIGWAVQPADVFYPVSLRVIGEEVIETPTGKFDCWKVAVDAGREHRIEWVRKTDGLGLRSYDERNTPAGHRVYDLLNP